MRYHIKLKQYGDNITKTHTIPRDVAANLGYDTCELRTNSEGFITYGGFNAAENVIYLLGDSFVECSFVKESKRLSDVMNELCKVQLPDFCVYNCGMSRSSSLHLFNLFLNKIAFKNNFYIFYFPGAIDGECNYTSNTFWTLNKNTPYTIENMDFIKLCQEGNNFVELKNMLKLFHQACQIFNGKIIYVLVPCRQNVKDIFDSNLKRRLAMNKVLRKFYEENDLTYFDLTRQAVDTNNLFYDVIHLNTNGASFYGELLINKFIEYLKRVRNDV